jgi:nitrate/nitrite transporter NarK
MPTVSRSLTVAPHLSMLSVGYTLFAFASVPAVVRERFGTSFVSVGLLMSAVLLSFSAVQLPAGRLLDSASSIRISLGAVAAHGALSVALDFAPDLTSLLALRVAWGLAGGLVLTAGATHFDRLYDGPTATRHQGILGGMVTLGGALAFLTAPVIVRTTGWVGVHAATLPLAVAAAVAFVRGGRNDAARRRADGHGGSLGLRTLFARPPRPGRAVWLAGLCYVAVLGGYITLSTFVSSYLSDLGVVGRSDAAILLLASLGRIGGGVVAEEYSAAGTRIIVASLSVAVAGFLGLAVFSGLALVVLPFVTILAVSSPFGAVFNVAAEVADGDERGTALSVVIAVGNFAALTLPLVTGVVRDVTGGYRAAFGLLAVLCAAAVLAGRYLGRAVDREPTAASG